MCFLNIPSMMSAPQFSSKMLKHFKEPSFVGWYYLPKDSFLPTKVSQLNASLMMSAAQFSSKMLKDLKEQRFCRKVWRTQRLRSAPQFSFKMLKNLKEQGFVLRCYLPKDSFLKFFLAKTNFAHFVSFPLGEKLVKHLFWQK